MRSTNKQTFYKRIPISNINLRKSWFPLIRLHKNDDAVRTDASLTNTTKVSKNLLNTSQGDSYFVFDDVLSNFWWHATVDCCLKQRKQITLTVSIALPVLSSFNVGPFMSVSRKKCFPFTAPVVTMSRSFCIQSFKIISLPRHKKSINSFYWNDNIL